jgi:hypothetical protein
MRESYLSIILGSPQFLQQVTRVISPPLSLQDNFPGGTLKDVVGTLKDVIPNRAESPVRNLLSRQRSGASIFLY